MCGIAGIIDLSHCETRQGLALRRMADRMRNRGPDDEGYVCFRKNGQFLNYYGNDTSVHLRGSADNSIPGFPRQHIEKAAQHFSFAALAHRRLSIVDLSPNGHQPMATPDLRYWIVYNGEVYNFREIAAELETLGITFHSSSDTEVILQAFATWGPACLDRFNGMFAFAVWDNKEKTLFCARDRIGIKPFYYAIINNTFIFASDIKTIIASGLYRPKPDMQGLYLAMAFGIAPRPKTAFKDVRALEQAHWMKIDVCSGKIRKERYWSIPIGTQKHNMSESEAVDLLEERLTSSIKYRLVADVPVGTFMSGGIDSTTISAMASRLHPGIKAFTLAYEGNAPEFDEVEQARATAAINPMEHIVHTVKPEATLKYLDKWVEGYEEPFYHLAANYVISGLVKDNGVTVVLNGLGGDELFAGYPYYRIAHNYHLIRLCGPVFRRAGSIANMLKMPKANQIMRLSNTLSQDRLHTSLLIRWPEEELHRLFSVQELKGFSAVEYVHTAYADQLSFTDPVEAFSYMDLINYIGNHHVHRVDQFTMAHSIEGRFPFLDHNMIEAAFMIPTRYKIKGKVQKYVLRKVAEKYIAQECLAMKKKGFGLPLKPWMKGALRPFVENKLSLLRKREIFDSGFVNHYSTRFREGNYHYSQTWHLVMLELWYERFIERKFKDLFDGNLN